MSQWETRCLFAERALEAYINGEPNLHFVRDWKEEKERHIVETKVPYDKVLDIYNKYATMYNWSKITAMPKERKIKVKARFANGMTVGNLEKCLLRASKSNFLKGSTGWTPSFDWFMKNDLNYLRVLEGAHDDKELEVKAHVKA